MNDGISTMQPAARAEGRKAGRMSLRARFGGALLTGAALLALAASPVSAGAFKNANITRTSACHYTVTFTWESMGHG